MRARGASGNLSLEYEIKDYTSSTCVIRYNKNHVQCQILKNVAALCVCLRRLPFGPGRVGAYVRLAGAFHTDFGDGPRRTMRLRRACAGVIIVSRARGVGRVCVHDDEISRSRITVVKKILGHRRRNRYRRPESDYVRTSDDYVKNSLASTFSRDVWPHGRHFAYRPAAGSRRRPLVDGVRIFSKLIGFFVFIDYLAPVVRVVARC